MALKSNPQDAVARWRQGVGAAGARYTQGVQRTQGWLDATTNPTAVAARNAGLQAAIANGAIERGLRRVGDQGWKDATVAKAQNWQTGVNSPLAVSRATDGFNRLFTWLQGAQSAIGGVPRGGFAENMQRMVTHATYIHEQAQAYKQG